jgi:hypothetical protein
MLCLQWSGSSVYAYRSFADAIVTQFALVRRQTSFLASMTDRNSQVFAALFTVSYEAVVMLCIYCWVVVSLIQAYRIVRRQVFRYSATENRDYEMIDFMVGQFKKWVGITKPKPVSALSLFIDSVRLREVIFSVSRC